MKYKIHSKVSGPVDLEGEFPELVLTEKPVNIRRILDYFPDLSAIPDFPVVDEPFDVDIEDGTQSTDLSDFSDAVDKYNQYVMSQADAKSADKAEPEEPKDSDSDSAE